MLKTAATIVAGMCEDMEDPGFLPLVKYLDVKPFGNAVALLLNSPQSALICNLPEKWVQLFGLDQQAELAALSVLPSEDEEEDKDEKEFKAMLLGFLRSMVSLASPLVKAKKARAKAKEMTPAKPVMPHVNDGAIETLPTTRAHGRPMKEDTHNVGWMLEEMLVKVLLATMDEVLSYRLTPAFLPTFPSLSSFPREFSLTTHWTNILDTFWVRSVCIACIRKVMAPPPAPVEELFCLETPELVEETAKKPANKKKQKPKKCEQEDDKDSLGLSQKQSCLL
ncbi:hypothetical protein DACRYDRAFT_106816 [Dacryopinax primogenitus]|uniref:Uncharacterized protein n=1 Tax=Dacryopinax primogenitus (strain DJM 731) TaxID=1858805 RepID=M5GA13_DACPD|nr:uncharacterized protein DACRYDRAFT_106816 [Dacryopinax primogenitus]EJU02757.1 hypothetical protein DACRYDRAFT_106816 [Dacryopinax primogenitus]